MALHLDPAEGDAQHRRVRPAGEAEALRLTRDGVQALARGALICPGCALPVVLAQPIGVLDPLRCGFCDHAAPARQFVHRDVWDTTCNQVHVLARLTVPVA